jgi:adenylate kinase
VDGTSLFRRADDQENVVRKRIKTYKKETLPLIDYYKKKGVLIPINGIREKRVVADKIIEAMN